MRRDQLYSDFAQPFQLFDMMLLIYHISDYRDTEKVIETWTQLIEQSKLGYFGCSLQPDTLCSRDRAWRGHRCCAGEYSDVTGPTILPIRGRVTYTYARLQSVTADS